MAYQNSVSPLLLVKCSYYSLVVVQPFKVGLQFQISSHQATALSCKTSSKLFKGST